MCAEGYEGRGCRLCFKQFSLKVLMGFLKNGFVRFDRGVLRGFDELTRVVQGFGNGFLKPRVSPWASYKSGSLISTRGF